ncbi:MAG: porin, partial [Gammaproteobacteria bacterium]|nr:porin [Gammaproteobacteria bacterium]
MNKLNRASALQTTLTLATSALILLPSAAQAVEVSMSGQVNRLIMNIDNGVESGVVHADNSVSGTRWRLKGDGELDNGMTAGLVYETQLQSNPSNLITEDSLDTNGLDGNIDPGDLFTNRLANVWLKGNFGKVAIGLNSGAADGASEVDDSGTTVIQYSGASADLLGSMNYGNTGVFVALARTNFDGLSRYDNIRYDAAIQNFALAATLGNGGRYGLSARYVIDNFKIMIGTWDENDANTGLAGSSMSASWVADNGFNLTGAYGSDD